MGAARLDVAGHQIVVQLESSLDIWPGVLGLLGPAHIVMDEGPDSLQWVVYISELVSQDLKQHDVLLLGLAFRQGSCHGGPGLNETERLVISCKLLYNIHEVTCPAKQRIT